MPSIVIQNTLYHIIINILWIILTFVQYIFDFLVKFMVSDDMFSAEAGEKEKPVVVSLVATSDQGAAAVFRKLFKKAWAKTLHVAEFHSNFPFIKVLWRHPFFQERWQNSSYKSNLHYLIWSIFSADNAFSFDTKGPKEKALQKEKPVVVSLSAESDRRFAGGSRQAF